IPQSQPLIQHLIPRVIVITLIQIRHGIQLNLEYRGQAGADAIALLVDRVANSAEFSLHHWDHLHPDPNVRLAVQAVDDVCRLDVVVVQLAAQLHVVAPVLIRDPLQNPEILRPAEFGMGPELPLPCMIGSLAPFSSRSHN
ncbi:MAG: hypothetical protein IIA66_14535, partial [Planctomycetes bacterium]|nr:hypothetical protein [Planctomycetota bacterium]